MSLIELLTHFLNLIIIYILSEVKIESLKSKDDAIINHNLTVKVQ